MEGSAAARHEAGGFIDKAGKTEPAWWGTEKASQRELDDATDAGDDEVEIFALMNFWNSLVPILDVKGGGDTKKKFIETAVQAGMFDEDQNILNDEISYSAYRNLHLILQSYLTFYDAHQGDNRVKPASNTTGIPPGWLKPMGGYLAVDPSVFLSDGLVTLMVGANGSGKSHMMAWMIKYLRRKGTAVITNLKLYGSFLDEYNVRVANSMSEVYDNIAELLIQGVLEVILIIDEFDSMEGMNAWESRRSDAGALFRIINQMRKIGITLFVGIHNVQDANIRWKDKLKGVHCVINKGMHYPPRGDKKVWDAVEITSKPKALRSAAIWWKKKPVNLQNIPDDVKDDFETRSETWFEMDYNPEDTKALMRTLANVPLAKDSSIQEREDYLYRRGVAIEAFNKEWRSRQAGGDILKKIWLSEAAELKEVMTLQQVFDEIRAEYEGTDVFDTIPKKFKGFKSKFYRYMKSRDGGS